MLASILIATRNRSAALRATLDALARVAAPAGLQTQLIVVDNGSTDDTRAVATSATTPLGPLVYLHEPRPGKSLALNTALAEASGDILIFLDDDVRPRPDWLRHITEPIAAQRYDALAGSVRIAPHLLRPWMTGTHRAWLAATDYLHPTQPETAVGANMAIARRVLQRVPHFDPELGPGQLGLWEDSLFSSQLQRAGFRLGLAHEAIVEHHFDPSRLTRKSFLAHARNQGRSTAYVDWHWRHNNYTGVTRDALHYRFLLAAKRLLRRRDWQRTEGAAKWEIDLTCGIAYLDQLRRERHRPRTYAQFGNTKLS